MTNCTVAGGFFNKALNGQDTVGGGSENEASGGGATVGGGSYNIASGQTSTVGGGYGNRARGEFSVVSGGGGYGLADSNSAVGDYSVVSGGRGNVASGTYATVGGGYGNQATADYATIAGGGWSDPSIPATRNLVTDNYGTVGGGGNNQAGNANPDSTDATYATVGGGYDNTASGYFATVPGGDRNTAAGRRAKANHEGTFVWADGTDADFISTGSNQFLIRASGGVGIGTTDPSGQLHVAGEGILTERNGGPFVRFLDTSPAPGTERWVLQSNAPIGGFRIRNETDNADRLVIDTNGNVGIGTTSPGSYKLYVNGSLAVNNSTADKLGGGSWGNLSDARLKDITGEFDYGLEKIVELQPIRYRYKEDNELGVPADKEYIGFTAQDVQKVIPEAVREGEHGYLVLESDPILWTMLNAIKEQQKQIESLQSEVKVLKAQLNAGQ